MGTFTLPLGKKVAQAVGIDLNPNSIEKAKINAKISQINNVQFYQGTVEETLPLLELSADLVLLDPPRKGCEPTVIDTLKAIKPPVIIYISCQPATLARDLQKLCQQDLYHLEWVQPIDFFPQTPHIESIALIRHNRD